MVRPTHSSGRNLEQQDKNVKTGDKITLLGTFWERTAARLYFQTMFNL